VSNRKTEADLREIFSKFGGIVSVSVRRNEKHKKLYAFVEFGQPEEATEAVDKYSPAHAASTTPTSATNASASSTSAPSNRASRGRNAGRAGIWRT
jgi:RNA recognition motif-containing protein